MTLEIRAVQPDEYEASGRLVVAAYDALPGNHMSGAYAKELADVGPRAAGAEVLVAVDSELLGCVTFVPDASSPWAEMFQDDEAGIRMLAVDPAAQGRGVGQALLAACLERGRQLGRAGMFLHSTPWMTAAHRLYQGSGFQRVPERDWLPVPDVPLLAFRLDLSRGGEGRGHPEPGGP
jgi:ribosomal protein S18 acetylase RimI-like enzyme